MKVIGLCGFSGSGKTTCANLLQSALPNVQIASTGAAVRHMMKAQGLSINHNTLQEFNLNLKSKLGDRYISVLYESIRETSSIVLIDALRTNADYVELQSKFGGQFLLLGLQSTEGLRYERMKARNREGDVQTVEEFNRLTSQEQMWGAEDLMHKANLLITNNTDCFDDLSATVLSEHGVRQLL